MKSRAFLAAIILAVLCAIPTFASAAYVHYFNCDLCHRDGAVWNSVDAAGICIDCHTTGGGTTTFNRPGVGRPLDGALSATLPDGFAVGDASNAMGSNPAAARQLSHNWGAGDTNANAGATPPSTLMYDASRGASRGFVTCYRCHDPHTQFALATAGTEMLRTKVIGGSGTDTATEANVESMCVECHKDWANITSAEHGLESHPIVPNYNAVVAAQVVGQERYKPFAPNGELTLLAGGKIGCSTCHGTHFTDSDSATADGPGIGVVTGDGMLLKGDGASSTSDPTKTALCTSCHMYQSHPSSFGAATQMGCLDCHSGHSPNDGTPNYYVLRSEVNVPLGANLPTAGTTVTGLRYLSTANPDAGMGTYCAGCHGTLAQITASTGGAEDHTSGHEQCTLCHSHYDPTAPDKSFAVGAGGCTSCHGAPPRTINAAGPDGYAVNGPLNYSLDANYKPENTTAHATHALAGSTVTATITCNKCHNAYPTSHNVGTFQSVLEGGANGALATANGLLTPVYAKAGNGTCSAVYCHSNGGKYRAGGKITADFTTTAVNWANQTITGCTACHDSSTTNIGSTGPKNNSPAHAKHVTRYAAVSGGTSCDLCHYQTTNNGSAIADLTKHVNGTADLQFDTAFVIDTTNPTFTLAGGGAAAGGCTVTCHGIDTPSWDQVGPTGASQCGKCHSVDPATIDALQVGGAHARHLTDANGPMIANCNVCHTHDGSFAANNGHIDGLTAVKAGACLACHGAIAAGTGVDAEPVWETPSSVNCETCHSGTRAVINAATAPLVAEAAYNNGHGKVGVNQACTACHEANTVAGHLGGATITRLSGSLPAYVPTDDRAFCTNCHAATTNNHNTLDGNVCKTCHAQHGEANGFDAMVMSTVAGKNVTGFTAQGVRSSYVNVARTGICQTCHAATTKYFNATLAFNDAGHNPGPACNTCHSHGSTPKAFAGAGNACDACHGFPPATAAHAKHAPDSALLASPVDLITYPTLDRSSCDACHTGAALYTYSPTDDQTSGTAGRNKHNVSEASQDATLLASVGYTGTNCATACHDGASGVTAVWTATSLACDACHYQAADPTQAANTSNANSVSAGHNAHFAGGGAVVCTDCHNAVADTTHITDKSGATEFLKIQGMATALQDEALVAGTGFNTGTNTCATASCHNNARPGVSVPTSAWGTNDANCTQCHAASPTTGSHVKHIPAATDCSDCHTSALQDTSYINTNHYDGDIDVAAGSYPTNKTINSAFAGCTTATCHDDGRSANTTPVWGTPAADACVACHDAIPATGSHATHVADAAVTCTNCHTGAVESTTAPTTGHRDGNIDVTGGSGYPTNRALTSAFTNCTTASCHNDGRGSAVTGTWGTPRANCGECHAVVPTTGGHSKHVGVSFGGSAIACGTCHTGAVQGSTAPTANHRDGNTNAVAYPVSTNGGVFLTCATASCHQTGQTVNDYVATPLWDANTANCTQCHAASPTSGSHTKHIVATGDCATCHTAAAIKDTSYNSAAHGDLNVDVAIGSYPANKVIGTAATSCAAITCHSDGLSGAAGGTPVWGTAAGCASCHASDMTTGSHTVHLADGATCGQCHTGAVKDTTPPVGHTDGNVDVVETYATLNAPIGAASWTTCSAASCHDDGRAPNVSAAWGTTVNNCAECHATQPATGSHTAHLAAAATCGDCHTGTTQGTTAGAGHRDTNIDTAVALGYTQNKAKSTAFTTCATASCHNDGRNSGLTGIWGATLNNCSECHATAPITGSHSTHSALYACGTCHTGTTQGTTAGAGHRDGNIDTAATTGLTANKVNGTAFTTCATNNCHGSGSPVWGTNLSTYDQCTQCHGQLVTGTATEAQKAPGGAGVDTNGNSAATDAQVGAHQIHLNPTISKAVACSACHQVPGTITAAGHIGTALPAELTYTGLALGGLDGQAAVSPANSQAGCATTYCHDGAAIKNGWDGGTLAPTWTNTAFLSGTVADCDNCHGYPPAGSHVSNTDCSACHDVMNADDLTFTAAGKLTHVDGIVQASGGDNCLDCHNGADIDGVYNGAHGQHADAATFLAGKTISGGGSGGAGWYGTVYTGGQPKFGCGQCHPGEGLTHPVNGLNVDVDPAGETPGVGNVKTLNLAGTATISSRVSATCATVYCHSDAKGAFKTSPNWYGGSIGVNCNDCHGNSPTTNAHGVHEVGIHAGELYDPAGPGLWLATGTPGSGAGHGDPNVASTIGCATCHINTVAVNANAGSTTCSGCHTASALPNVGNALAAISNTSTTHINGVADVVFASMTTFKTKAQLRDDITTLASVNGSWTRTNGYKAASSYDLGKGTPVFTPGADTCSTVACHNGIVVTWQAPQTNCLTCHTELPK